MKNVNNLYLAILALAFVGCTTENVLQDEQIILSQESQIEQTERILSKNSTKPKQSNDTSSNSRRGISDSDGNIFDGTNDTGAQPNDDNLFAYLVEFVPGLSVTQKNMIRLPYQGHGDLVYFEQCTNHPDKELWYMNPQVSVSAGCPENLHCSRTDYPPIEDPDGLREVIYKPTPSCN